MSVAAAPSLAALEADPRIDFVEDVLRFGDTDSNGHINNAVFSVLCESGRVHLFDHGLAGLRREGRYVVIARFAIDYRRELHYPGRVRTATWVTRVGRTSLSLAQAIFDGEALAAEAEATCVTMLSETRRPAPFTEAMRETIGRLLRPPAG